MINRDCKSAILDQFYYYCKSVQSGLRTTNPFFKRLLKDLNYNIPNKDNIVINHSLRTEINQLINGLQSDVAVYVCGNKKLHLVTNKSR